MEKAREEVHIIIRFLWAKHISSIEIYCPLIEPYDFGLLAMRHFLKWCKDIKNVRTDANDANPTGQLSTLKRDVNEDLVMNWFLKPSI